MTGRLTPPPQDAAELQREQLLRELRALETPELLALCLRGKGDAARLRQYLTILRGRPGTRAQLASCLVCFDLARSGDALAQTEFLALAGTIHALARDAKMVGDLLGGDAYLVATWTDCQIALAGGDQREAAGALDIIPGELVGELDLLSGEVFELDDEVLPPSKPADPLRAQEASRAYHALLTRQLGQNAAEGILGTGGFLTTSSGDLDRLEAFLNQSLSYAELVPTARGMASLGHLFLATHLRMRTIFGKPNPRRAQALRTGLLQWPDDVGQVENAAAIFELEGGPVMLGFEKVLELILDYLAYCKHERRDPRAVFTIDAYVAAERQPAPVLLSQPDRRRRS